MRAMCCFSGPVERVSSTQIFARMGSPGRQVLVYQMTLAARSELAMVLPLPVPPGTGDDAVRWIALDDYESFFDDLHRAFPVVAVGPSFGAPLSAAPLAVVTVGHFVASFVPSLRDFARLDPRFRMPPGTLDRVPLYADWGFAVFQLRPGAAGASQRVHPMAFEFPTRAGEQLFFPTLHVHDGALHPEAWFDHVFFAQHIAERWPTSRDPLRVTVDLARSQGLVDGDAPVKRNLLAGRHPNQDVWVARV
jgi:hypothetical protein